MTKEQAFVGDRIALRNGTVHGAGGTAQHEVLIPIPFMLFFRGQRHLVSIRQLAAVPMSIYLFT